MKIDTIHPVCLLIWLQVFYIVYAETERLVWAKLSERAELTCEHPPPAKDDPVLLYLWFKDSNPETIYSFDNRDGTVSSSHWYDDRILGQRAVFHPSTRPPTLVINPVDTSDQGLYICRVQFKRSPSAYAAVNLSIIIPPDAPVILYNDSEVYGYVGPLLEEDRFELVCRVRGGYPAPQVGWWHNQRGFLSATKRSVIGSTTYSYAYLSLTAVRRYHAASLECRTYSGSPSGDIRSDVKKNSVSLNITLSPLSVKLSGVSSPLSAGTTALIVCRALGSSPPAHVTLHKGSQPISETTISILDGGNSTSLSTTIHVTRKDNGVAIKCEATNSALPAIYQEASTLSDVAKLNVFYKPHVELKLGRGLDSSNLIEGQDAFLQCLVDANPPPHRIEWFRDGEPLNLSTKLVLRSTDLALQKLERDDSGSYTCSADNLEGKGHSPGVNIDVKHAPVCAQTINRSQGAAIGNSANISCRVWANPYDEVSFYWSKMTPSGREKSMTDVNVTTNGLSSFLSVTLAHIGEFGKYLCRAKNSIGQQSVACGINVVPAGPPYEPQKCSSVADGDSLMVSCEPGFDGGIFQRFNMDVLTDNHIILTEISEFPTWVIEGLEGGVSLSVQIWSFNTKGNSSKVFLNVKMPTYNQQSVTGQHVPGSDEPTLDVSTLYAIVLGAGLVIILLFIGIVLVVWRRYRRDTSKRDQVNDTRHACSPDVVSSIQNRSSGSPFLDVLDHTPPLIDQWGLNQSRSPTPSPSGQQSVIQFDSAHKNVRPRSHFSVDGELGSDEEKMLDRPNRCSRYLPVTVNYEIKSLESDSKRTKYMPKCVLERTSDRSVSELLLKKASTNLLSAKESAV